MGGWNGAPRRPNIAAMTNTAHTQRSLRHFSIVRRVARRLASPRVLALVLAAVALIPAAAAQAAGIGGDSGSDGYWCSMRSVAAAGNSTTVQVGMQFKCLGAVNATVTVKRNGVVIYQAAHNGESSWGGALSGSLPIGYSLLAYKTFGSCTSGANYQVVATYSSSNPWYGGHDGYVTSGTPRPVC
jgi:hypothetical protein